MPMPYWMANRGGLFSDIHTHATSTPISELRRCLPPSLAAFPDDVIPDLAAAWALVQHGHSVDDVDAWFELGPVLRAAVAAARSRTSPGSQREGRRRDR